MLNPPLSQCENFESCGNTCYDYEDFCLECLDNLRDAYLDLMAECYCGDC